MNASVIDAKANDLLKNILDAHFKSERSNALLYRLGSFYRGASMYIFSYIQPMLMIVFAIILLLTFVVSYKRSMLGAFQAILLLSNFVDILGPLLNAPITLMFSFFSDVNVPMPYPACLINYHLNGPLRTVFHITAQYLHLLIGINRLVAVYKPFKLRFWFSKKRTVVYCSSIIFVGVMLGAFTVVSKPNNGTKKWVDDIWLNGKFDIYTVCFFDELFQQSSLQINLDLVLMSLACLPALVMIVMNVALVKKLRNIKNKRSKLNEVPGQNDSADKRTDAMNRIAVLVTLSFILCELPTIAIKIYTWVAALQTRLYGIVSMSSYDNTAEQAAAIGFEFLFPIDLFLYITLSRKLRKEIKQSFLSCCKCRKKP